MIRYITKCKFVYILVKTLSIMLIIDNVIFVLTYAIYLALQKSTRCLL